MRHESTKHKVRFTVPNFTFICKTIFATVKRTERTPSLLAADNQKYYYQGTAKPTEMLSSAKCTFIT